MTRTKLIYTIGVAPFASLFLTTLISNFLVSESSLHKIVIFSIIAFTFISFLSVVLYLTKKSEGVTKSLILGFVSAVILICLQSALRIDLYRSNDLFHDIVVWGAVAYFAPLVGLAIYSYEKRRKNHNMPIGYVWSLLHALCVILMLQILRLF